MYEVLYIHSIQLIRVCLFVCVYTDGGSRHSASNARAGTEQYMCMHVDINVYWSTMTDIDLVS